MKKLFQLIKRSVAKRFLGLLKFFEYITYIYWNRDPNPKLLEKDAEVVRAAYKFAVSNIHESVLKKSESLGNPIPNSFIEELGYLTQSSKKISPLNIDHGYLLYSLVRDLASKNNSLTIFETGTARGFSSIIMSKACYDANCYLRLITLDVLPHTKPIYWNSLVDLKGKTSRKQILSRYKKYSKDILFIQINTRVSLPRLHFDRINFAFLDGAHKYEDVITEGTYVASRQTKGDIMVFDDYNQKVFSGIVKAIHEINKKFDYQMELVGGKDERFYAICRKN